MILSQNPHFILILYMLTFRSKHCAHYLQMYTHLRTHEQRGQLFPTLPILFIYLFYASKVLFLGRRQINYLPKQNLHKPKHALPKNIIRNTLSRSKGLAPRPLQCRTCQAFGQ